MAPLEIADILGPNGLIARRLQSFEERPEQLHMASAVQRALAQKEHLLVEAGTGVGKSFAYLVPAILSAIQASDQKAHGRIVISTHTISLQEQLLHKDIPFLQDVIPFKFVTCLVKGRANYLSRRRLEVARGRTTGLFSGMEDFRQLKNLTDWSQTTSDGSLSDLPWRPQAAVWDEVVSDSGNCQGRECPSYASCFYYRARSRMQHAQLLIVNHALFFSHIALIEQNAGLLPEFDAVVLDEAHTVPDVASDQLGMRLTSRQFEFILNKLYSQRNNKGLLSLLALDELIPLVIRCQTRAEDYFDKLRFELGGASENAVRIRTPQPAEPVLSDLLNRLSRALTSAAKVQEEDTNRLDLQAASQRLEFLLSSLDQWQRQSDASQVYWLEQGTNRRGHPWCTLNSAPLEVGPKLRELLFRTVPSVILTSATLATGGAESFDYCKQRLGMDDGESMQLGSPFNYRRCAKLILLPDMPDPTAAADAYRNRCLAMIRRYVARSHGHAFVLFTSYSLLRFASEHLAEWFRDHDLAMYCQGEGTPRHQMVEQFKANPRGALFGTDSFWQGVDVPGDALQLVVITRLPFMVPDRPLPEARAEQLRERGGNPFMQQQVPEAILKLRQGFGRLIRSKKDRGAVVILDPRVRTKFYGEAFLKALPPCQLVEESCHEGDD